VQAGAGADLAVEAERALDLRGRLSPPAGLQQLPAGPEAGVRLVRERPDVGVQLGRPP